jgi:thiaminase/transcriptional activator TenA
MILFKRLVMKFSRHLKKIARPIWDAQLRHPFVRSLGDGNLPPQKFKFYILQDSLFLFELSKVFAAAAIKSPDTDTMAHFTKLQSDTLEVERALHQEYGKRWKMTEAEMSSVPMAPTNYAYTRHMLHVALTGNLAEITNVALPCAWIYCEVGAHLCQNPPGKKHPYKDWLALYSSPEFAEVAEWMCGLVDRLSESVGIQSQKRMEQDFIISSRYEWLFWEMAWREESWPV